MLCTTAVVRIFPFFYFRTFICGSAILKELDEWVIFLHLPHRTDSNLRIVIML